jgi:hypothetical protein
MTITTTRPETDEASSSQITAPAQKPTYTIDKHTLRSNLPFGAASRYELHARDCFDGIPEDGDEYGIVAGIAEYARRGRAGILTIVVEGSELTAHCTDGDACADPTLTQSFLRWAMRRLGKPVS